MQMVTQKAPDRKGNEDKKIQVQAACDNPGACLGGCVGNPVHYKLVETQLYHFFTSFLTLYLCWQPHPL